MPDGGLTLDDMDTSIKAGTWGRACDAANRQWMKLLLPRLNEHKYTVLQEFQAYCRTIKSDRVEWAIEVVLARKTNNGVNRLYPEAAQTAEAEDFLRTTPPRKEPERVRVGSAIACCYGAGHDASETANFRLHAEDLRAALGSAYLVDLTQADFDVKVKSPPLRVYDEVHIFSHFQEGLRFQWPARGGHVCRPQSLKDAATAFSTGATIYYHGCNVGGLNTTDGAGSTFGARFPATLYYGARGEIGQIFDTHALENLTIFAREGQTEAGAPVNAYSMWNRFNRPNGVHVSCKAVFPDAYIEKWAEHYKRLNPTQLAKLRKSSEYEPYVRDIMDAVSARKP